MDRLQVEQERGITVKAQTASLFHTHKGKKYLINLIDTPGHVDFGCVLAVQSSPCDV
jgi:translation elongation factor EF-G